MTPKQKSTDEQVTLDHLLDALATRIAARLQNEPSMGESTRLLTVAQAATYLGRSTPAVHRLIASKKLPVVRADRRLFVDRDDLDRFIQANKH